jgi:hypothetical protein
MTGLNKILLGVSMVLLLLLGIALGVIWNPSQPRVAAGSEKNNGVGAPAPLPVQPPPARSPSPPAPSAERPPPAQSQALSPNPPSPASASLPPPFNVERQPVVQTRPFLRNARPPAMSREKLARLQALQQELRSMTSNGQQPDPEAADRILGELIEIQGASVISGVDLNVLRKNLKVAQNIQNLAKALEEEGRKPHPDGKKMNELRNSIYQEQQSLLSNAGHIISPPTAGTAAPGK